MSVANSQTRIARKLQWLTAAALPALSFAVLSSMTSPLTLADLSQGSLEEVLLTTGRWLGLALTAWLVTTQLLYTAAVLTRTNWMVEVLRPVTLPIVRRIAAGATALSMTMSNPVAVAQPAPEQALIVVDEPTDEGLRREATPTPVLQPLTTFDVKDRHLVLEPEGSYSAPLTWQVRPGDHLWSIAGEHLAIVLGRPPTRDEHHGYWMAVVEAARPIIRSGDPDLIYPGEHIPLPATLDTGMPQ